MKKRVIIIAAILLIIFVPYIKVEILTMLYGEQFEELHNASGWVDEINFYKIMKYKDDYAEVYYVSIDDAGENEGGFLYKFIKEDDEWILDNWNCIWSKHGNADEFIWPYYFDRKIFN